MALKQRDYKHIYDNSKGSVRIIYNQTKFIHLLSLTICR